MDADLYQKEAMFFRNPRMDQKDTLINGLMGLCGETGEAADHVKKWLFQGHDLDRDHMALELGDIAWYLAETAYALDIPLSEVFSRNLEKLRGRYPGGFSPEASRNRTEE